MTGHSLAAGFTRNLLVLADELVAGDLTGVCALFQSAQARPPLFTWQIAEPPLADARLAGIIDYWRALGVKASSPADAFDVERLGNLADYAMLVDVLDEGLDFGYRHYGRALKRHYGHELQGRRVSDIGNHVALFAAAVYRAVMLCGQAAYSEHEPPSFVFVRRWSRVILPLVDSRHCVTQLLVGSIPEDPIRAITDTVIDGVLVADDAGLIRIANPAVGRLLARRPADLVEQPLSGVLRWSMLNGCVAPTPRHLVGRLSEITACRSDGSELPVEVSVGETSFGGRSLLVVVVRDITERKANEAEMRHLAYHDPLTGAANRALFKERLEDALARARRGRDHPAVVLLDLDHFKDTNDAFGHGTGDGLLVGFARRIGSIVRETDLLARLGGDEFAVLLTGLRGSSGALTFASRVQARLSAPILVSGRAFTVQASIGVASWPAAGSSSDELLLRADQALYAAKHKGGGCVVAFERTIAARTAPPTA